MHTSCLYNETTFIVITVYTTSGHKLLSSKMDFHGQKMSLSFSIENILREDFAHQRRPNFVYFPTQGELDFERWPSSSVYQCCSVRFLSPGFVKCLPNIHGVEDRLQRPNAGAENLSLKEEKKSFEEDGMSYNEEVILQENGKRFHSVWVKLHPRI